VLILGSRTIGTAVMSLQTGARLARTAKAIIDPAKLSIFAYELDGPLLSERPAFLRVADIRETGGIGMIVDSADEFIGLSDVIKLEELYTLGFPLVGMKVVDEHRRKLGKVEDYTLETGSFVIQQLHIKRGILQGITYTGLLVHRSQIFEINDAHIVVKGNDSKVKTPATPRMRAPEYVNPFRNPAPTTEQSTTDS
jgi:uncharacterized protein YrrD